MSVLSFRNTLTALTVAGLTTASVLVASPAAQAAEVCKPGTKGLGYCQINVGGRITLNMNLRAAVWATAQHNRPVHLDRTSDSTFRTWEGPLGGKKGRSSTFWAAKKWWRACADLGGRKYACTGFHKWNEY